MIYYKKIREKGIFMNNNFCSKCGNKLEDDAKFCHNCGEKLVTKDKENSN